MFDEFLKNRMLMHQNAINENLDNQELEKAMQHRFLYKELELVLSEYQKNESKFDFITVDDVSNLLKISKPTINRAIKKGELNGIQISHVWLFTYKNVMEYKELRESKSKLLSEF